MGLLNDFFVSVSKNWGFNYENDRIETDVKHVEDHFDVKELMFKVEPHYYSSDYYIMKYSYDGYKWYKVTRVFDNYNVQPPERDFPHLDSEHNLLKQAKEFKQDPSKFKSFNDRQDELYKILMKKWTDKQESYKNRKTHII